MNFLKNLLINLCDITPPVSTTSDSAKGLDGPTIILICLLIVVVVGVVIIGTIAYLQKKAKLTKKAEKNLIEDKEKSEMKEIPQRAPIVCPVCGSREIAFISEWHKCIGAKFIAGILFLITISLALVEVKNTIKGGSSYIALVIVFAVLFLLTMTFIWYTESKTHAKAICRDCGHIWLLD